MYVEKRSAPGGWSGFGKYNKSCFSFAKGKTQENGGKEESGEGPEGVQRQRIAGGGGGWLFKCFSQLGSGGSAMGIRVGLSYNSLGENKVVCREDL